MALDTPHLPDDVRQAFEEGIKYFLEENDSRRESLRKATLRGIPMLTVELDDLSKGVLRLEASKDWRVLALSDAGPGAADIGPTGDGRSKEMIRLSTDQTVLRQIIEALGKLDWRSDLAGKTVALLRIPGILTEAFLLRKAGSPDQIVPVLTRSREIAIGEAYSVDDFLTRVQPIVKRFLQFANTENRPPKRPSARL